MSASSRLLVEVARRRGFTVTCFENSKTSFAIQIGDKEYIWDETAFGNPSALYHVCKNKLLTHTVLKHHGYNVPSACIFSIEEKDAYMDYLSNNPNIVVKPLDGSHGDGITVLPQGEKEFEEAWEQIINGKNPRKSVLVEEYVGGEDYRILVVANRCIFVSHRVPATVIGDGVRTVQHLINRENLRPSRGKKRYEKMYSPIAINKLLELTLRHKRMTLESIPKAGERVVLTGVCNIGCGGTQSNVTSYVHPQVIQDAIELGRRLGMDIVAIDTRHEDIRKARSLSEIKVLELNATPGLTLGNSPWTIDAVWDAILERYQ